MALLLVVIIRPLIAAEASHFVLIQNWRKNQVSRNASFRARPLPCKSGRTWAAKFLRRFARSYPPFSKYCYALPLRTWPASFCLISAEAVLLTGSTPILLLCTGSASFCRISGEGILLTGFVGGISTSPNSQFVLAGSPALGGVLGATLQSLCYACQLGQGLLL